MFEIARNKGRIVGDVAGKGPLVVCVPGMGESRASFRHLVPGLVAAGYRVATMDLRGHSESSTSFESYDDPAVAGDVVALIDALGGGSATVVGNSMGAAAAVIAAAEHPATAGRIVLIGAFVRDHGSAASRWLMQLMLSRPWGPAVWRSYYASPFGSRRQPDHDQYVDQALALLRRPGRWRAFQKMAGASHTPAQNALSKVPAPAPALILMGDRDRDFPDPEAEAVWIAEALHSDYRMINGAGHYPMAEQPATVLDAMAPFLRDTDAQKTARRGVRDG